MPIPFNDFTGHIEDRTIGPLVLHFITGESQDGFELSAQEAEWTARMKEPDVRAILSGFAQPSGATNPVIETRRDGERENGQALIESPTRSTYLRVVKTPRAVFTLTCDFASAQRAVANRVCADFLSSFEEIRPRALPDFTAPPLPGLVTGAGPLLGFNRADLEGKLTLVTFLGSWCLPCLDQKTQLDAATGAGQVRVFAVALRDDAVRASKLLAQLDFPIDAAGLDAKGDVAAAFGVTGAPETVIVDRRGMIVDRIIGPIGSYGTPDLAAAIARAAAIP